MAIQFDGSTNNIVSAAIFSAPTPSASVSLWLCASSLSGIHRVLGYDNLWEIRTNGTDLLMELFQGSDLPPSYTIATDTWYHVVCTYSSSGDYISLWVDGVLRSGPLENTPSWFYDAVLSIGQRTGAAASERWSGLIDDVRIYSRVLSQAEIETIYACRGRDSILRSLQNRWTFQEGAPGDTVGGAGTVKDEANALPMGAVGSPVYAESILNFRRR